jgi:Protein of unknown function (DUF1566)/Fibronectin type III domain
VLVTTNEFHTAHSLAYFFQLYGDFSMKKTIRTLLTGITALVLVACGGSGGGDTRGISVQGKITGLNQSGLVLQLNGANDITVAAGSSSFTFDGLLPPFAAYRVTIKSQPTPQTCAVSNDSGTAPFAVSEPPISNVVISCGTVNIVPQNLTATAKNGSASFDWSAVANATQYRLYYAASTSLTAANATEVNAGLSTTYTLTGLTNGTTYTVAVSAVVNGVTSTWSSIVSVMPKAGRITNVATHKLAKAANTYVKISNQGEALPSGATQGTLANDWSCTLDDTTGLLWELKTATGTDGYGAGGSRPVGWSYNYSDAQAYISSINALNLCGFNDWRLPTRAELHSLVKYSLQGLTGAIDQSLFVNTEGAYYWTATEQAGDPSKAWFVAFWDGQSNSGSKTDYYRVRLVRAGVSTAPAMEINPIDTTEIEDVANGIVWQRCAAHLTGANCDTGIAPGNWEFNHSDAKAYAAAQASATGKAWRLPTVKELASLADLTKVPDPAYDANANPALNLTNFPGTYQGKAFWTNEEAVGDTTKAWVVNFHNGGVEQYDKTWTPRVRLVRNK